MKTKSLSFRLFVTLLVITSVAMALLQLISCKQTGGTCTYKGLECPNAQQALAQDGDVIDSLETELSACQLKDHSQIPDSGAHLDIKRDGNHNNAITSIVYTDTDGKQYRLRK